MTWRARTFGAAYFALALCVAAAPGARAQSGPVIDVLSIGVAPSAYPADWQTTSSLALLQVINSLKEPVLAEGTALLFLDSGVIGNAPVPMRVYNPGSTVVVSQQFAIWSALTLTGRAKESVDQTGRLPDGTYGLCVVLQNIRTFSGQTLSSATSCGTFILNVPKPPSLLSPSDGSVLTIPTPVFQWTPVFASTTKQPPYRFRLVEVLPGQTPLRAIEANRAIYETFVENTSSLSYPAPAPMLETGRRYAWRVQSVRNVSTSRSRTTTYEVIEPFGANYGLSQVFTFTAEIAGHRAIDAGPPAVGPLPATGAGESRFGASAIAPTPRIGESFAERLIRKLVSGWRRGLAGSSARLAMAEPPGAVPPPIGPVQHTYGPVPLPEIVPKRTPEALDSLAATADSAAASAAPGVIAADSTASPADSGFGPQWLKLHGTASLSGETYSRDGSGSATRPDRSTRVVTGLSLGFLQDRLRVPVDALVSGDQVSFRQNINQVGVFPHWEWAGLTAGSFSPQYSTFTLADATLLGGGFEVTPRQWRVGFVKGRSRKAIAPSADAIVQPQFARDVTAGRVGYGDPLANSVDFSVVKAEDDEGSLADPDSTILATPQGNTVYALRARGVLPSKSLHAEIETALSRYDRDRRADSKEVEGKAIGLKLARETATTRAGISVEYLNGGFTTFGNSNITGDRFDIGLNGRVQLLRGKLTLDAATGFRNDAVSEAVASETSRKSYTLTGSWQPTQRFGTDFQTAYFTNDANSTDSTAGMNNTTRVYSISSRVMLPIGRFQNTVTGSALVQSSDNNGPSGLGLYDTKSLSLLANWSTTISGPWSVSLAGNYTRTDFEIGVTEISTFGPGVTWASRDARFQGSTQLQFTRTRTGNAGIDAEAAPRFQARWEFARGQALVLRGNFRRYDYANPKVAEFNERLATLEYVTSL